MPKCPNCNSDLEQQTEITGYHYWMCGNSNCPSSYKFYRNAAQQKMQRTICPACGRALIDGLCGNDACAKFVPLI